MVDRLAIPPGRRDHAGKVDIRRIEDADALLPQIARQQKAIAVEAKAGDELRRQAEARDADGQIERGAAGKPLDPAGDSSTASTIPSPMLTTVGISAHCKLVWRCSICACASVSAGQAEHDAVEQDQADCSKRLPPNCSVVPTGTCSTTSAMAASVPSGLCVSVTTSAPSCSGDAGEADADRRLAGAGDDQQRIALADRRRRHFADKMHGAAEMHEAHRRHLRGKAGTSLPGKEPAPSGVVERGGERLRRRPDRPGRAGRLFPVPRPAKAWIGNLSRIHCAISFGICGFGDGAADDDDSGSTAITACSVSGPMPPASETRKPRACISLTASICAVDVLPASRASVGEWTAT